MNHQKVIEDFNNGTLDKDNIILVMDNDGGYWSVDDDNLDDSEIEVIVNNLEHTYGSPDGYSDLVNILRAAGVSADWC